MANRNVLTVTGSAGGDAVSDLIPMHWKEADLKIGIGVELVGAATGSYTVEHTFDDIYETGTSAGDYTYFNHEFLVNASASDDGHYAYPAMAFRLRVAAGSTGDFKMTAIRTGY